jgi:hypothetical protein
MESSVITQLLKRIMYQELANLVSLSAGGFLLGQEGVEMYSVLRIA